MDDLIKTIIAHEGSDKFAYHDSKGFVTVGVGRCLDRRCGHGLSDEEINYLLTNDIKDCENQLSKKSFYINQDIVHKQVLVELVFNMGMEGLEGFKNFLNAFEFGHYTVAVSELKDSLWAKEVHAERVDNICFRIVKGRYP